MYLVPKLSLIYIRVPKTGSTSFVKSLKRVGSSMKVSPHSTAIDSRIWCEKEWKTHKKIGFVRYPFDWVQSYFKTGLAGRKDGQELFERYIYRMQVTPMDWLCDEDGELMVDKVYRMEDMKEVCEQYGLQMFDLNQSKCTETFEFNSEMVEIIKDRCRRELEYY